MVDTRTIEQRRRIMQSVRIKDTGPEIIVRKIIYGLGYRYRLHRKDLPGRPDICFPGKKKVIFVHGCFWHGHLCKKGQLPKSKLEYWQPKINANKSRDAKNVDLLEQQGWKILILWQCELYETETLLLRLEEFLRD
ncbi:MULTISPECIES: very short patch repair endonuclease [unclassified Herbaspirillum]|uniref:very short patch repair endonuclease n=1 Tax=unclassified Herbaspirillum TaxID=2624150 RepID=UPI00115073A1|nr:MULTISPECIES: very short patch repair endonuclease [unclassified Herbaspirillum]MBB5393925.1 DNA mismatch endonuclease (patch repair protein) [Herbaspirillum sp. SJZ102]TQK00037.1 T/G mismatch-specific endonuclease [Herbaspirillum sp. SJZ130]TQK04639.1 T/G mismatch-specific endonuclease [Herbaspirillum sp. SJZ106]